MSRYSTNRYTLTVALLREMRAPTTENAVIVCTLDRARVTGTASPLGHAIPSIFHEPRPRPERIPLTPLDDEEPTMLLWGTR
jgi:hypothetical protein